MSTVGIPRWSCIVMPPGFLSDIRSEGDQRVNQPERMPAVLRFFLKQP